MNLKVGLLFLKYKLLYKMPQLDQMSFFSQVFWYLLFFYSLYFIILQFILPIIFYTLKFRIRKFGSLIQQLGALEGKIKRFEIFHIVMLTEFVYVIKKTLKKEHNYYNNFVFKYQIFFTTMRNSSIKLQEYYYNFFKNIYYNKSKFAARTSSHV